jgi:hypothetical protein
VNRVNPGSELGRETCRVLGKNTELRWTRVTKALLPQIRNQLGLRGDARHNGSGRDGSRTSQKVQIVTFL